MLRGRRSRRLWPLAAALLATALLAAVPLLAQALNRVYLPSVGTALQPESEVAPQMLRVARVMLRGPAPDYNGDEYVQIRNVGAAPAELDGLRLSGALGLPAYSPFIFPPATLPPGASALVFSKVGSDNPEAGLFYLDRLGDVWEPGRAADLRDAQGLLLSRLVVSGPPPPTPTTQPTVTPFDPRRDVRINAIELRDPAFPELTEEYVAILNMSNRVIDLTGWRLLNASRPDVPAFVFPSYAIGADYTIAVFSGVGEDDPPAGEFYWDQPADVWRVGDRAELRDTHNDLIATFTVPQP